MAYDFKRFDEKIAGVISFFENEIATLRTGRATPALLENIKVEAYGTTNSIKNVAAVRTEDAKTLIVEPWDKSIIENVAKGIETSNLGIQPVIQKGFVRVTLPSLTQERRTTLLKILSEKLEDARVNIRKFRDELWKDIQAEEKAKKFSEDEKFRLKNQMEEKVKKIMENLENTAGRKEKEITD